MSKDKETSNWLATLGSWLVVPFKAILKPWWKKLVEDMAEAEAVKSKLLEAMVRFRVNDFKQKQSVDEDRAAGLAGRVIERLRPLLSGLTAEKMIEVAFVEKVESEIELAGCPHEVWAKLACLACLGQFDPKMALKIQFTHQDGRQSHSSSMIAVIQDSFCFARVLAITDIQCGQLSPSIIQLLKEYCSRATLPAISYQIAPAVSMTWMTIDHLSSSSVLSEGWKPV